MPRILGLGSNIEDLVTGLDYPFGLALDVVGSKMYWTGSGNAGKIQRANLDGSNIETLIIGVDSGGLALDMAGGKIYWTEDGWWIRRANLDGSNIEDVTGSNSPRGLALDVAGGKIYWTGAGKIQRANLDGSNIETLVTGLDYPFGLALYLSRTAGGNGGTGTGN